MSVPMSEEVLAAISLRATKARGDVGTDDDNEVFHVTAIADVAALVFEVRRLQSVVETKQAVLLRIEYTSWISEGESGCDECERAKPVDFKTIEPHGHKPECSVGKAVALR